ncbi:unnamed protein product [Rangifer tarandus platyrhynchus]|uniref:Uncharacterized protein n=1 Tax=Rangifer tarandus platyrhynchus TaxID=3082113 RepID=A0AC59ZU64_RANTA
MLFSWSPGKGVSTNQLEAPRAQQLLAKYQLPLWADNPQLCDPGQLPQPRATDLFGTTLHLAPAASARWALTLEPPTPALPTANARPPASVGSGTKCRALGAPGAADSREKRENAVPKFSFTPC